MDEEIKVLLLGLDSGLFIYQDILEWLDICLENDRVIPDDLYDIPFVKGNKTLQIRTILLECCKWNIEIMDIKIVLGVIYKQLEHDQLENDEALSIIYKLLIDNPIFNIDDEMERKIHYLSDGYFLATTDIYGDADEIIKEFTEWLRTYQEFSRDFNLPICFKK